jgi:nucleotide-binding universal stress UspA family protein
MATRILAAIDGSEQAAKALDFAIEFTRRYAGELHLIYAAPDQAPPDALIQFARVEHLRDTPTAIYNAIGESLLNGAQNRAAEAELTAVFQQMDFGDAAKSIIDYAHKHAIDVIVMGTRGFGELQGLLLGSVSMKVQSLAPCTCICVR